MGCPICQKTFRMGYSTETQSAFTALRFRSRCVACKLGRDVLIRTLQSLQTPSFVACLCKASRCRAFKLFLIHHYSCVPSSAPEELRLTCFVPFLLSPSSRKGTLCIPYAVRC